MKTITCKKVLRFIIFIVTILTLIIPKQTIYGVAMNTATPQFWHSVTRGGHTYSVYRLIDGNELIGLFAQDGSERVKDAALELLLIYDAATLDVPEDSIVLPGTYTATPIGFLTYDHPSWATNFIFEDGGEYISVAAPAFMSYGPGEYVHETLWHAGCVIPLICKGLDNQDHMASLYADVILATILQSELSQESSQETYEQTRLQLISARDRFHEDQLAVDLIDMLLDSKDVIIGIQEIYKLQPIMSDMASHTIGEASALISALAFAFDTADLTHSISAHNILTSLQFQFMVADAEQRIADLTMLLCNSTSCSLGQQQDPMIKGLEIAHERFNDLKNNIPSKLIDLMKNPEIAINVVEFTTSGVELTIQLLMLLHVIHVSAAVSGIIGIGLITVEMIIVMNIDFQSGQDELRRVLLSYNLFRRLRDSYDSISDSRRYSLSILNMAYYSLLNYFDEIGMRSGDDLTPPYSYDPVDGWIFEQPGNLCNQVTPGNCTRNIVAAEAVYGAIDATSGYLSTQFGTYLTYDERNDLKEKILTRYSQPTLWLGRIAPTTGVPSTNFQFSVIYSDPNNLPPNEINLVIDSVIMPLQSETTNYGIGATYSGTYSGFGIGSHNYYFFAQSGSSYVRFPETGTYSFLVKSGNTPPAITLFTPDNDFAFRYYKITWNDYDPDNDAEIQLGYDPDGSGCDGNEILHWWSEDWPQNEYMWRSVPLSGGPYWVYAIINDGHNAPVCSYSPGKLFIETATSTNGYIVDHFEVDDSEEGDGDGIWESGETAELVVYINNISSHEQTDVYGILTPLDGGIRMIDPDDSIWAALPGVIRSGIFEASSVHSSQGMIPFNIDIYFRQDGGPLLMDTEVFQVPIVEPGAEPDFDISEIEFTDSDLTEADGDGILESGEDDVLTNILITNIGGATASNIEAVIAQPEGWDRFWGNDDSYYSDLIPGDTAWGETGFRIDDIPHNYYGLVNSTMSVNYGTDRQFSKQINIPVTVHPTPWIKVVDNYYAFGLVNPGTIVTHDFVIENYGTSTAIIDSITTSDSDLTFTNVPSSITSGGTALITAILDTTDLDASVVRTITINSNAHILSRTTGTIAGTVHELQPSTYEVLIDQEMEYEPMHIGSGDTDGDGLIEVILDEFIFVDGSNNYSRILVLEQIAPGSPEFTAVWNSGTSINGYVSTNGSMHVGDINNDGHEDIILGTLSDPDGTPTAHLYYLTSNGNNSLSVHSIATSTSYKFLTTAIGDSDGDNVKEIIVSRIYKSLTAPISNVMVYEYTGGTSFSLRWTSPFISEPGDPTDESQVCGISAYDTDRDGYSELVLGTEYGQLEIYESTGNNMYSSTPRLNIVIDPGEIGGSYNWCDLLVTETDNDYYPNIIYANDDTNKLYIYESSSNNTWGLTWSEVIALTSDADRLGAGDVDLDGNREIIISYRSPDGAAIYESFGNNNYAKIFWSEDPAFILDEISDIAIKNIDSTPFQEVLFASENYGYWVWQLAVPQDLVINSWDINYSPENPTEVDVVSIEAAVTNASEIPASGVDVAFYLGDPNTGGILIDLVTLGTLPPYGTGVAALNYQFTTAGDFEIFVEVDVENEIQETDETNNYGSLSFNIADNDTDPPAISGVELEVYDGDGDGLLEDNEQIQISWFALDPSGIDSVSFTSDCTHGSVFGTYSVLVEPCTVGIHNFQIVAVDADNSPSSSSLNGNFLIHPYQPVISEVFPLPDSINVSKLIIIQVEFEFPMAQQSLNSSTFYIRDESNTIIPGIVSYDPILQELTLVPDDPLLSSSIYYATLMGGSNGIKDENNNYLVEDYSWSFSTVPNQPPVIVGPAAPLDGSQDILLTADLEWDAYDPENEFLAFDVYFGTTNPPTNKICNNITDLSCDPGVLDYLTPYYWKITAFDRLVSTSGPVWSFTTRPSNYPPIGISDDYVIAEDSSLSIAAPGVLLNDSDPDGNEITAVLEDGVNHGELDLSLDGSFIYNPEINYSGIDEFSYRASDGYALSELVIVTLQITPINDPPSAIDDTRTTSEDTAVLIDVLANDTDIDGDLLTLISVTQPTHGQTMLDSGQVSYTPALNYFGEDIFTYSINDGQGGEAVGIVTVIVTSVNDPPEAQSDDADTTEDATVIISVLGNDQDVDGDELSIFSLTQPQHGYVIQNGQVITYTPILNYNGTDTFSYTISDGNEGTDTANVNVTITPVNDAPDAIDDEAETAESIPVPIFVLENDMDVDGDPITITEVNDPLNGQVVFMNGVITYTPSIYFTGVDEFIYTISDGETTDTASVIVTVVHSWDAPTAVNDTYITNQDLPLIVIAADGVLANDLDPRGTGLTASKISDPLNGILVLNDDGSFTYTPNHGFLGNDRFTYRVYDGMIYSNVATAYITVIADIGALKVYLPTIKK